MDVKWGSLYTVVQSLEKHQLLEAIGTSRQGARPERTIYRITEAGVEEMVDWTRELLLVPEREHPRFIAGLSLIMVLTPETVVALLTQRLEKLEAPSARRRRRWLDTARRFPGCSWSKTSTRSRWPRRRRPGCARSWPN